MPYKSSVIKSFKYESHFNLKITSTYWKAIKLAFSVFPPRCCKRRRRRRPSTMNYIDENFSAKTENVDGEIIEWLFYDWGIRSQMRLIFGLDSILLADDLHRRSKVWILLAVLQRFHLCRTLKHFLRRSLSFVLSPPLILLLYVHLDT